MNETFEVGFYEFIRNEMGGLRSELAGLESRMERRFSESEARTDKRFDKFETEVGARFNKLETEVGVRFNKLEEEVRWPRRIAVGGVITTVIATMAAVCIALFGVGRV
jgi:acyl-coenzyme A thioesterase PaaI-like protein